MERPDNYNKIINQSWLISISLYWFSTVRDTKTKLKLISSTRLISHIQKLRCGWKFMRHGQRNWWWWRRNERFVMLKQREKYHTCIHAHDIQIMTYIYSSFQFFFCKHYPEITQNKLYMKSVKCTKKLE